MSLAYAPAAARADWLAVLALDARLARVVNEAREPMLAQLKLAWWRDRFAAPVESWPAGEPLLACLRGWGGHLAGLSALVDGWEAALGEPPLLIDAVDEYACGRARAMAALAQRLQPGADLVGIEVLGRRWALADFALHRADQHERAIALELLARSTSVKIARPMRPLTILAGLSVRAVDQGSAAALYGPGALFTAIRLGITGG